ncbi:helix-turn-helix transcriptional regulator [Bradymonas sediminis]|uniref:Uncharacterized protein n=1 Tax=Bradymonas sediminis TaxID=1548548 RepID=A0A2Z4FP08_9DELT|nr:DeoR family transcriptional regulator [Bradymonas sediminis]AWV90719.1 hypothetical protein DN745_15905 [Bradymonas sediminis]TDP62640.1 putative ArsR family transcriptional regulator [Bradymonas sediminis]
MPNNLLNILSASRTEIVLFVQSRGDVSVEEASSALGLASTTIRQHFDRLEAQGILEFESVPSGRGRPTSRYRLTANGRRLFPSQDGRLLGAVLDFMLREGYPGLVNDVFIHTWAQRKERLLALFAAAGIRAEDALTDDPSPEVMAQKLAVITDFLSQEGFMSKVEQDGDCVRIKHHNCPFSEAVRATKLPCRLEAELFEQILGGTATRLDYMPDGDTACTYEFRFGGDKTPTD